MLFAGSATAVDHPVDGAHEESERGRVHEGHPAEIDDEPSMIPEAVAFECRAQVGSRECVELAVGAHDERVRIAFHTDLVHWCQREAARSAAARADVHLVTRAASLRKASEGGDAAPGDEGIVLSPP
jgi:hypothetical protein